MPREHRLLFGHISKRYNAVISSIISFPSFITLHETVIDACNFTYIHSGR